MSDILDRLIKPEKMANDYTEAVIASRSGYYEGLIKSGAAAAEICAGMLSRALASAKVRTENPMFDDVVGCGELGMIGRELVLAGECAFVIDTKRDKSGFRLLPCSHFTVRGDPEPETWEYLVTLAGPSGTRTFKVPSAGVIHAVWSRRALRPWEGQGPLENAGLTSDLMNGIENYLAKRARLHPVIPVHQQRNGPWIQPENLRQVLSQMMNEGQSLTFLPVSQHATSAEKGEKNELKRLDVGLSAVETQMTGLRQDVAASLLSAAGLPVELVARAAGQDLREAMRLYIVNTIQPLAKSIGEEFSLKFGVDVELDISDIQASDIMSRARAVGSLVQAGMPLDQALTIASLTDEKKNK